MTIASLPLLEKLQANQAFVYGTIGMNGKGLPINMKPDKERKICDFYYRFSMLNIVYCKWFDNKVVPLASNFHGSEKVSVKGTNKDATISHVPCSIVVKDYNKYAVDHAI